MGSQSLRRAIAVASNVTNRRRDIVTRYYLDKFVEWINTPKEKRNLKIGAMVGGVLLIGLVLIVL
jgi:hypothetical protein